MSDTVIVSVDTVVRIPELRNIRTQSISESALHIMITKNGHPRLGPFNKRASTILDERAKSAKDNLLFPF